MLNDERRKDVRKQEMIVESRRGLVRNLEAKLRVVVFSRVETKGCSIEMKRVVRDLMRNFRVLLVESSQDSRSRTPPPLRFRWRSEERWVRVGWLVVEMIRSQGGFSPRTDERDVREARIPVIGSV
ncbi:hypothetical protein [Natronosalvus vescus]|uniref:hypothetical protein n=1 Tax=Natronosalvus vescus TaxID=2953881 RepID=UPI0020919F62|nr:hypothetical protein [Natronosalvus vescus]